MTGIHIQLGVLNRRSTLSGRTWVSSNVLEFRLSSWKKVPFSRQKSGCKSGYSTVCLPVNFTKSLGRGKQCVESIDRPLCTSNVYVWYAFNHSIRQNIFFFDLLWKPCSPEALLKVWTDTFKTGHLFLRFFHALRNNSFWHCDHWNYSMVQFLGAKQFNADLDGQCLGSSSRKAAVMGFGNRKTFKISQYVNRSKVRFFWLIFFLSRMA